MSAGKPLTTKNIDDVSMAMITQVIPMMETKAR